MAANNAIQSKQKRDSNKPFNLLQYFKERVFRQKKHMEGIERPPWLKSFFGTKQSMMTEEIDEMLSMGSQLVALDKAVMAEFNQTKARLQKQQISGVIIQRHEDTVLTYQKKFTNMMLLMDDMNQAQTDSEQRDAIERMAEFMAQEQFMKPHKAFEPGNIVQKKTKIRKPHTKSEDFHSMLYPRKAIMVAANGDLSGILADSTTEPSDLSETTEIRISERVKGLSQIHGKNPVRIYNWVRNNIEYVPVQGATKNAEMTLQMRKGSAAEIASLLIAILRAAGIRSKYRNGTIRVPIDRMMNWVGAKTANATQEILGQGGIPNVAIIQGGIVKYIELEHIWVEAYIDYEPSRGAVNRVPDTWVPLDASFKQYQYTEGMDLSGQIPIAQETLREEILKRSSIDEEGGIIQQVDITYFDQYYRDERDKFDQFIEQLPDTTTFGDLFGARKIIQTNYRTVSTSMPYKVKAIGKTFNVLPKTLQHTIKIEVFNNIMDRRLGSSVLTQTLPISKINSQQFRLQYEPSSDEDRLLYKTSGESIPAYLISLAQSLRLDGKVLSQGGTVTMGQSQYLRMTITGPTGPIASNYTITAGDEMIFAVNGGGITTEVIRARASEGVQTELADNLHFIGLFYWMEHDTYDQLTAQAMGTYVQRLPSVGIVAVPLTVRYYFGIPRSGRYLGHRLDVQQVRFSAVAKDKVTLKKFISQIGVMGSYIEGSILEQLFNRPESSAASAAQVIMQAQLQGIPLYVITSENIEALLPKLVVSEDVKVDIRNAARRGMVTTIPERDVTHRGWTTLGYIIRDAETGAGQYLLDTGFGGSSLPPCSSPAPSAPSDPSPTFASFALPSPTPTPLLNIPNLSAKAANQAIYNFSLVENRSVKSARSFAQFFRVIPALGGVVLGAVVLLPLLYAVYLTVSLLMALRIAQIEAAISGAVRPNTDEDDCEEDDDEDCDSGKYANWGKCEDVEQIYICRSQRQAHAAATTYVSGITKKNEKLIGKLGIEAATNPHGKCQKAPAFHVTLIREQNPVPEKPNHPVSLVGCKCCYEFFGPHEEERWGVTAKNWDSQNERFLDGHGSTSFPVPDVDLSECAAQ